MDSTLEREVRELVEVGKRMRAVQIEFFRTRRADLVRSAKQLESDFDRRLEELEKNLNELQY